MHGQVRVRKDYSYATNSFVKDGMLLAGAAACFVDPVFSTGVHLATYGGLLAARSINSVLGGELDEATVMAEFEGRYRREYGVFYVFLTAFYDMRQREESYFWEARKVTAFGETDLEAFATLAGGSPPVIRPLPASGSPLPRATLLTQSPRPVRCRPRAGRR